MDADARRSLTDRLIELHGHAERTVAAGAQAWHVEHEVHDILARRRVPPQGSEVPIVLRGLVALLAMLTVTAIVPFWFVAPDDNWEVTLSACVIAFLALVVSRRWMPAAVISSVVLFICVTVIVAVAALVLQDPRMTAQRQEQLLWGCGVGLLVGAVIMCASRMVFRTWTAARVINVARYNARVDMKAAGPSRQLEEARDVLIREEAALRRAADGWFPPDYLSVDAIAFITDAVRNFKADSIREAVNLRDAAVHRRAMEDAERQLACQMDMNHRQLMAEHVHADRQLRAVQLLGLAQLFAAGRRRR